MCVVDEDLPLAFESFEEFASTRAQARIFLHGIRRASDSLNAGINECRHLQVV